MLNLTGKPDCQTEFSNKILAHTLTKPLDSTELATDGQLESTSDFAITSLANLRVLIVEDSQCERLFIEQTLINFGVNTSVSSNGSQALEMHKATPFDLIISDWRMPEMTGLELCQILKGTSNPPYLILLTANNQQNHNIEGIEAGADDFMTKPFVPAVLKAHLLAASRIIAMQHKLAHKNRALNNALIKEQLLNEQIQEDLTSAAKLQQSLLPQENMIHSGWKIDSHFQPATSLAGDIFQCIQLDKNHLGFYLLDVAGHGIAPAMQGFTLAQQINQHREVWLTLGPAVLLNKLANDYQDPEGLGRFATLILASIEINTGQVRMANAGHPMPQIFHRGQWQKLVMPSGLPLGIMSRNARLPGCQYKEHKLRLGAKDRLMLYSDGVYEAHHPKWGQFGEQRLTSLCQSAHELGANSLINHLSHSLTLWQEGQTQDDISIMILSAPEAKL